MNPIGKSLAVCTQRDVVSIQYSSESVVSAQTFPQSRFNRHRALLDGAVLVETLFVLPILVGIGLVAVKVVGLCIIYFQAASVADQVVRYLAWRPNLPLFECEAESCEIPESFQTVVNSAQSFSDSLFDLYKTYSDGRNAVFYYQADDTPIVSVSHVRGAFDGTGIDPNSGAGGNALSRGQSEIIVELRFGFDIAVLGQSLKLANLSVSRSGPYMFQVSQDIATQTYPVTGVSVKPAKPSKPKAL